MIWRPSEKPKTRNLNWKTLFCCLSGDDGGDGEISMMLWVSCPGDEGQEETEGAASCSCREEQLDVLPSPLQEVNPAV